MRLLHTSDWHLGRSFHGEGMLDHQAAHLDHLLEVVRSEGVEAVLVAGDVYDRALPPVDAVALLDETLARLAASPARTVVTSGNHDSTHRLGFGSRVMDAAGIHLRTRTDQVGEPVVLHDAHGPVAVHGLPYLDPDAVREPWGLEQRSHETAVAEAVRRVRADLAGRPGVRSVLMAHAFVAGSAGAPTSDSERDLSVGGVQRVPVPHVAGFDYTALGHLHAPHVLTERVRYSGSPLAYSFSEAAHTKGSWLVDLGAPGGADDGSAVLTASFVPAPVPRALRQLRGALEDLLADPALASAEDAWVHVTLTDPVRPRAAMDRLRRRFPHTLVLGHDPQGAVPGSPVATPTAGRSAHDVTLDFVTDVRGTPADTQEAGLLRDACDACRPDAGHERVPSPAGAPA